MPPADDIARAELALLRERDLLRALEPLRSPPGAEIELRPGERLINLSSNDYLGLAGAARIAAALAEGARRWGAGAGASRLVCGDFGPHHELEQALAEFEMTEAAVVFNSGYDANCGLLPVFAGPEDLVLSDALNHASLIDACRLSRARVEIYPHADAAAVDELLETRRARRKLVVTTQSSPWTATARQSAIWPRRASATAPFSSSTRRTRPAFWARGARGWRQRRACASICAWRRSPRPRARWGRSARRRGPGGVA